MYIIDRKIYLGQNLFSWLLFKNVVTAASDRISHAATQTVCSYT